MDPELRRVDEAAEVLLDDVANHGSRSTGADTLLEIARAGGDIGAAVGALAEALDHASQVGILIPAAEALAVHLVAKEQPGRLLEILGKARWGSYLADALTADAVDTPRLLTWILGADRELPPSLDLGELIRRVVEAEPTRLGEVVELLAGRHPLLLLELVSSRLLHGARDVQPALPVVAAGLGNADPEVRERAVRVAALLAGTDLELAGLRAGLDALVEDGEVRLAREAARARALGAIRDGERDVLAHLAAHPRARLRRELLEVLGSAGDDAPEVTDVISRGLLDPEEEVRKAALEALRRRAGAGHRAPPTAAALAELEGGADAARIREARHLLGLLPGEHDPGCSICRELPRRKTWSFPRDRPAALDRLVGEDEWRDCPECRAVYFHDHEVEWEDMHEDHTWTLRRLPLVEACALEGPRGEEARARRDARTALLVARLDHPEEALRRESAWDLARARIAGAAWEALAELLDHRDDTVRKSGWLTLLQERDATAPEEILLQGLEDALPVVRGDAAHLLVRRALRGGDLDAAGRFLDAGDLPVVRAAAREVRMAARDGADLAQLAPRLVRLAAHPDQKVRDAATRTLESLPADPGVANERLAQVLELLANGDEDQRSDAADALEDLARDGADVRPALPHLVALLDGEETAWHGLGALTSLVGSVDLSGVFPEILARIEGGSLIERAGVTEFLWALREDLELLRAQAATFARLLEGDQEELRGAAFTVFETLLEAGTDLAEHADAMERALEGLEDYQRERMGRFLGEIHVGREDWRALDRLLREQDSVVAYGLQDALAAAQGRGVDLSTLAGAITHLVGSRGEFVRQGAAGQVRKLWEGHPAVRDEIVAELRTVRESAERDELIAWIEDPAR